MAVEIAQLAVEEVIDKAESGATEPYLCRLTDDQLYVTKGRAALPGGLIREVVCALLGSAYGLPIPPIAIAQLDPALVAFNRDAQASLGGGALFASKYREHLLQVSRETLSNHEASLLRKLYLFDYWVLNEDRTGTMFGGNPNLFRDVHSKQLVVLDHNLAFSGTFDVESFSRLHICRDFWFNHDRLYLDRAAILSEMDAAEAAIAGYDAILPESWVDGAPEVIGIVQEILARRHQASFWEAL